MSLFDISAILLTISALCSFINYKWIKLPLPIGLMLMAMMVGLIGIISIRVGLTSNYYIEIFLQSIDFKETVFHGMLSFLLFAGAMQINIVDLKNAKLPVAITATVSTLISTILIGFAFYHLANLLGYTQVTLLYAMLFGAILSPTDPISVLAIIRKIKASRELETTITGEALFNDGVAIVFFLSFLDLINAGGQFTPSIVLATLLREAGGGILIGIALGWCAYKLLSMVDAYQVELLITLAVATGGYALAEQMGVSAPIAMVVAGLIIGNNHDVRKPEHSKKHMESFWEVIDEMLNAVLFVLIGLEMMVINVTGSTVLLGLACILVALVVRFVSILIPLYLLKPFYAFKRGTIIIMTWGGLRGALSIAMVLALAESSIKEVFLPCIYFVVVFSITVQGLTFGGVLKKYTR